MRPRRGGDGTAVRMRAHFALWIGAAILAAPTEAPARLMPVQATLTIEYGTTEPTQLSAVGTALVNPVAGGDRLVTLQVGSLSFGDSDPVPFTDPVVSALVKSFQLTGVMGRAGSFFDLSNATASPAQLVRNALPISGLARICLLFSPCLSSTEVDIDLTQSASRGVGVGGTITGGNTTGFFVSFHHAPWQLAPATLLQSTVGGLVTVMATGYQRGPSSNPSTAARVGGSIQLIAPSQVFTEGVPGGYSDTQALFTRLTLHFLPEPRALVLLGSGAMGLALLGRRRVRD